MASSSEFQHVWTRLHVGTKDGHSRQRWCSQFGSLGLAAPRPWWECSISPSQSLQWRINDINDSCHKEPYSKRLQSLRMLANYQLFLLCVLKLGDFCLKAWCSVFGRQALGYRPIKPRLTACGILTVLCWCCTSPGSESQGWCLCLTSAVNIYVST